MNVASFSIIIASMMILAYASDENTHRLSSTNLSQLESGPRNTSTVIVTGSHSLSKRSVRRQHIIIERRPLTRGPPRRRRRPPKFSSSFRPKSRPKPPKPIYGPPNYPYGNPIGYLVMNQNNEIIHQSKDIADLPSHFFDTRIPPNFINDGPPPPYQEEPEIIPSVSFESHSHKSGPPSSSLASEEIHTWTQYEEKPKRRPAPPPPPEEVHSWPQYEEKKRRPSPPEEVHSWPQYEEKKRRPSPPEEVHSWPQYEEKPKVRRKKPPTTPEPTPPSPFPSYSSPLKPQPPSTSYGVPVAPFSVSSFNPWLNGHNFNSQESSFSKPTRPKQPSHSSFPSQFELEHEHEKNLYEAPVSSYDVPLNYVSAETKPSFNKNSGSSSQKFPIENFDVGSFENNPSSSYQSYLPPQLPESYNDDDFPRVTKNRPQNIPNDYSGEVTHSEEDLEQPLVFSFKKPTHQVTRKPVFRQTTSAQEAFDSFVRELRPSLTTISPPTHTPTIHIPQPTTRRPRPPTVSHRPRLRPTSTHNLDTDDLREAYIESSASQEDYNYDPEPVNFESMRFSPDSRPSASDKRPHNYVLVDSGNRESHHTTSTENYPKYHPAFLPKPSNIDIISIEMSKSKSYYGGSTTSTRPPRSNPRGSHRQYTKAQVSRHDDMTLLHGENYQHRPQTTSHRFNPSLQFTKTFSSKITQPHQGNYKYQQLMWNGQELPKNHKITNRDM